MKTLGSFSFFCAFLFYGFSSIAQQTVVINALGKLEKDPEMFTLEVTMSNYVMDLEGVFGDQARSIAEVESDYLQLLRKLGIASSSTRKDSEINHPATDYSNAYTERKHILSLNDPAKYAQFSSSVYSVVGLTYFLREANVADVEAMRREAYTLALADAHLRAEHIAAVTGLRLGELISVEDLSNPYSPPSGYYYEGEYGWDASTTKCSFTSNLKLTYAVRK